MMKGGIFMKKNLIIEKLMSIYEAEIIMAALEEGAYRNVKTLVIETSYTYHKELLDLLTKAGYSHRWTFEADGMVLVDL